VDKLEITGELGKHYPTLTVYDAPEVATEKMSPAADVWSLGVTLIEALTQHPPVWDKSPDTGPDLPESIPQPFADIARECLRLDPARRCTLSDIKARLEPVRTFPSPTSKTGRTVPTKLGVAALVATAVLLLAVTASLRLRSHQNQSSLPARKNRPVNSTAAFPPQSPVPGTQVSKGAIAKGAVAERVLPNVPVSASRTIHGQVGVGIRVTVDPNGVVSNSTFDSAGVSKYFAKLALQASQKWKFKPAQIDHRSVSSVWTIRFSFRQTGTEVTAAEVSP
jgi:TonB family protein